MLMVTYVFFLCSIDASEDDGSLGRLLNDSKRQPNCLPKLLEIDNRPRLVFVALRPIEFGQELRYNYGAGDYPWRKKVN